MPHATPQEASKDPSFLVEETRVTPIPGFPAKVVLELLLVDGIVIAGVMSPMQAHRLSDDLLRGVALVKKEEQRSRDGGEAR